MKNKTLYRTIALILFVVLLWLAYSQNFVSQTLAGSIVIILFGVGTYFINRPARNH